MLFVCVLLVLGVVVVVGQTARHDFVNFDDNRYVYDNEHIKPGLTLSGLGYYLVHRHSYTFHPVTSISHMLDCQLFGVDAGRHHAISVLLHAATAVGLFLVLRQMTGRLWPSAMVAAVFALHPLRVESVAWISERRDVLSGLFFVLALWAYVRYIRRPGVGKYVTLCVLFALGLLAKPMLVTLPLLLLLLDYWPLERMPDRGVRGARDAGDECALHEAVETASDGGTQGNVQCETHQLPTASLHAPYRQDSPGLRRLLVEKIPLLAISLAACLITVYTQADGGAVQSLESVSLAARIVNTPIAYANYVGSFFWPQRLAVLYPHPCDNFTLRDPIVKGCLLIVASAVIALLWRRMPYLLVGWLWYLGTLVPVIGLLQVGGASMADRYTYLPQIGLAMAVVWSATAAADKLRRNAVYVILALASVAILTALAAAAWRQTAYWRNSEMLWTRELSFPQYDNAVALQLRTELGRAGHTARRSNNTKRPWPSIPRMKPAASTSASRTKPWTVRPLLSGSTAKSSATTPNRRAGTTTSPGSCRPAATTARPPSNSAPRTTRNRRTATFVSASRCCLPPRRTLPFVTVARRSHWPARRSS